MHEATTVLKGSYAAASGTAFIIHQIHVHYNVLIMNSRQLFRFIRRQLTATANLVLASLIVELFNLLAGSNWKTAWIEKEFLRTGLVPGPGLLGIPTSREL